MQLLVLISVGLLTSFFIGFDDFGNQAVADNVGGGKTYGTDALRVFQRIESVAQAGNDAAGQVDLT